MFRLILLDWTKIYKTIRFYKIFTEKKPIQKWLKYKTLEGVKQNKSLQTFCEVAVKYTETKQTSENKFVEHKVFYSQIYKFFNSTNS